MRVFVVGTSGVIGQRLLPLLVEARHDVVGMTRSPQKRELLHSLGAQPVVIHQLTDLPDEPARRHLPGDDGAAVAEHERAVVEAGGIVVRYGRLYGPGSYFEDERQMLPESLLSKPPS